MCAAQAATPAIYCFVTICHTATERMLLCRLIKNSGLYIWQGNCLYRCSIPGCNITNQLCTINQWAAVHIRLCQIIMIKWTKTCNYISFFLSGTLIPGLHIKSFSCKLCLCYLPSPVDGGVVISFCNRQRIAIHKKHDN